MTMKVLMASPEVAPFAKTGGLADVVGALPRALADNGLEACVVMPLHRVVKQANYKLEKLDHTLSLKIGDKTISIAVHVGQLPNSDVPVYFLEMDHYFDREFLYGTPNGDYKDNCERFIVFSLGVLELVKSANLQVDVIHCHDWQAALIPLYMKTIYRQMAEGMKSVLTIHNLDYQGTFWHWDMPLTGLDWKHFNWKELEFYGKLNFLKGGLVYADAITTVSKGYAREIQTREFGCGLEGVIQERNSRLTGIVNGIDYETWNPATDRLIPARFTPANLAGKEKCKAALQKQSRLTVDKRIPLIGFIGRLAGQKGVDLVASCIERLADREVQFVILGAGEAKFQEMLAAIRDKHPDKVSLNLAFNENLAHLIEAGSDMFLMPSRYEPCGLNQLYSLKYGTLPIVRETGGLADTVVDSNPETLKYGTASGFVFRDYDVEQCLKTIERALALYADRKKWTALMKRAMKQDWSWKRSAKEYIDLYCRL